MMKKYKRVFLFVSCFLSIFLFLSYPTPGQAAKALTKGKELKEGPANAAFDVNKMADMSDYDPANPVIPAGDTIKIAVVMPFSGPAALNGELTFQWMQWAAHDINKRGGIWVDGKKKLVQLLKADHMSKPDQCKKVCERMVLQEKVHVLSGTSGSNMMKVMMETANKYKVICHNWAALSDDLMDATQFNRYTFMTAYDTWSVGRGLAYYFGQIRKKEKKFLYHLPGLFLRPRDGGRIQAWIKGILSGCANRGGGLS